MTNDLEKLWYELEKYGLPSLRCFLSFGDKQKTYRASLEILSSEGIKLEANGGGNSAEEALRDTLTKVIAIYENMKTKIPPEEIEKTKALIS